MRHAACTIAIAVIALSACSDMPTASRSARPPGSKQFEYKCADGTRFDVLMAPTADKVKLELGGVMYELRQVRAGSGAKYSDGTLSYWSKGREATLDRGGKVLHRECRASD